MKKVINKVMYVFIILLSLIMFTFRAKALSVSCSYSNGAVGIKIAFDDNFIINVSNISKYPGFTSIENDGMGIIDFQDENENFYCPDNIYYSTKTINAREQKYYFNFNKENLSMPLVDPKIINDTGNGDVNGDGGNNDSKKIVRQCKYGEYVVYYYNDGTYSADAGSSSSVGVTPPENGSFENYCLSSIYVVTAETQTGKTASISFEHKPMSKIYNLTDGDSYQQFIDSQKPEDDDTEFDINGNVDCDSLFGKVDDDKAPAYWIQWCLNLIKYIAIVALLALVTIDFVKALVSGDKDALKKAGTTAIKRFIFCVLLFFLPIIVEFIMSLFGAYGTCGIG